MGAIYRADGWYAILKEEGCTSLGKKGPFRTEKEAWNKWDKYCRWLIAMDAN